jgi:RNA polymerase sigma-70 factor (ECF subfamily)
MSETSSILQMQGLLERMLTGDSAAKKQLVDQAYARLLVIARKLLNTFPRVRTQEETAGVLNEAYLRLHSSMEAVKPGSVREFLGLAALQIRRTLLDSIRKMGRREAMPRVEVGAGEGTDAGVDVPDTKDEGSRRELGLDLLEAMEKLSDEEREVVDLLFFHGHTQPEAGEVLGVHEDTVKRRWARARVKLARWLGALGASN